MLNTPAKVPAVVIYAGNDATFPTYTFLDSTGTGVDLSAWAWTAQWRPSELSERSINLSVDVSGAAVGTLIVSATDTNTLAMKAKGMWDLTGVLGTQTKTLIYGDTQYIGRVTRIV